MTLLVYKIIAAILIFLVSIISVYYPLKNQQRLKRTESISLGEAFASGIFLGTAFFHMLPDAIKLYSEAQFQITYPIPEFLCVFGFLTMLFLERITSFSKSEYTTKSIPFLLAIVLLIHALIEGAALGIGATLSETFILMIAILAHKFSESFALCIILLRQQLSLHQIIFIILLYSTMTPLGISFGAMLNQLMLRGESINLALFFNAFAAGTFIYISTLHHIHAHQHGVEKVGLKEFVYLLSGTLIMAFIALWT